jgi:uncharacterized protein YciI
MKRITNLTLIGFLLLIAGVSCEGNQTENIEREIEIDTVITTEVSGFDSLKAAEYGADEYGMKSYVMAFLKAGPNRDLDSAEAMDLQMAHMENIDRMAENGDLVLAGPFLDGGELRGIYIFNVETVEEAEALTNTDPAIQAGSLVMELKPWYGSAALIPVNDIHKTLSKKGITEE